MANDTSDSAQPFPSLGNPIALLRAAIGLVIMFALAGSVWLIDKAVLNPDVRAKQPGWFEGFFDMPFWLPLILTFAIGCAAVIAVYVRAAQRIRAGEDLQAQGFRARKWRELEERLEATRKR